MIEPITPDTIKNMIANAKESKISPFGCIKLGDVIKPTQEMRDLLRLCVDWYGYSKNGCGGELHVVLDDDNTDDYFLNSHLEKCRIKKYDNYGLAEKILNGLLKLTGDQRNWVTYNIRDALEGKEIEVYEERIDL
jgi:hypothetical protein